MGVILFSAFTGLFPAVPIGEDPIFALRHSALHHSEALASAIHLSLLQGIQPQLPGPDQYRIFKLCRCITRDFGA